MKTTDCKKLAPEAVTITREGFFLHWLLDRLDRSEAADPIGLTAEQDPIRAEKMLLEFAEFRRSHRTARPAPAGVEEGEDAAFSTAVDAFRRWFDTSGDHRTLSERLLILSNWQHFRGKFKPLPSFAELWSLAHPPHVSIMRGKKLDLQDHRTPGIWRKTKVNVDGPRFAEEAGERYQACAIAFRSRVGKVATAILASLTDYANSKRTHPVVFLCRRAHWMPSRICAEPPVTRTEPPANIIKPYQA
jgi:CRISPR-associated exonuclease Cas4